jgi:predicted amidohydrolase
MILNIALLQMNSCGDDVAANRAKSEAYCREAAALGADIALFPEMWSVGYTACPDGAEGRAR